MADGRGESEKDDESDLAAKDKRKESRSMVLWGGGEGERAPPLPKATD